MLFNSGEKNNIVIERKVEHTLPTVMPYQAEEEPTAVPLAEPEPVIAEPVATAVAEPVRKAEQPHSSRHLLIIQHGSQGPNRIHQCQDVLQAKAMVEALLIQGVKRDSIELFDASKVAFDVSFRPVVDFAAK